MYLRNSSCNDNTEQYLYVCKALTDYGPIVPTFLKHLLLLFKNFLISEKRVKIIDINETNWDNYVEFLPCQQI